MGKTIKKKEERKKIRQECYDKTLSKRYENYFDFLFLHHIRMSRKNIIFDNKKISKSNFYKNKKLIPMNNADVNKILVSKRESYGTKIHLNNLLGIMTMITLDHYV